MHGRQPGCGHADDDHAQTDDKAQHQRIGDVVRQYGGARCDQVAPVPPLKMLASTLATGSPTRAATDSGNGEQGIETQS
jgi:hypothetical protein